MYNECRPETIQIFCVYLIAVQFDVLKEILDERINIKNEMLYYFVMYISWFETKPINVYTINYLIS